MSNNVPERLSIPTKDFYTRLRKYQQLDALYRNCDSGGRSGYISRKIISPYIDLRDHLEELGVTNIMMTDIVSVIISNPSIINMLQKAKAEVAA